MILQPALLVREHVDITPRTLEGVRSGLSTLASLVIVDDEPLSHVESLGAVPPIRSEIPAKRRLLEKRDVERSEIT